MHTDSKGANVNMKAEKKVLGSLEKCYAVTTFHYDGIDHLVCSAEKANPCYTFDFDGNKVDTLWEGPGGVMTLLQYPCGDEPILMATQKFFSPNNSAEAKIVYYTRDDGKWNCHVLCDLPFVHRFGILDGGGEKYLIACTLKSAHAFKDDWTCPGRVWTAVLPKDIKQYDEDHQLELTPFMSGLYKNHGFGKCTDEKGDFAVVGTENGIFKVVPPQAPGQEWTSELLLNQPTSDMLYLDFDGDGERELLTLSPFHGDTLSIYKKKGPDFLKVWEYPARLPFLHAIWGTKLNGKDYAFVGCRQGNREFFAIYFDKETGTYKADLLDQGAGAANCVFFEHDGQPKILAANRESDEIAVYTLADY